MPVGIIGIGNVGTTLLNAFIHKINDEIFLYDRKVASIPNNLPDNIHCVDSVKSMPAERIFITVNDESIHDVIRDIKSGREIIVMSGITRLSELEKYSSKFSNISVMHPLAVFPDTDGDECRFRDIMVTAQYSSSPETCREFCSIFGCTVIEIEPDIDSALYHAACVFASNFMVVLAETSSEIFCKSGIERKTSQELMLSLLRNTVKSMEEKGVTQSFSGPVVRGDIEDIIKHVSVLNTDELALYRALTNGALKMLRKAGSPACRETDIREVLDE